MHPVRFHARRAVVPVDLPAPISPALVHHAEERASEVQNRIADRITTFAGSMAFVYIHIVWFGCWIGFGVEDYPFGLLTMIVSLEAIFLSTFVMISQNRADAKRQVIADQQWRTVQEEDQQNKAAAGPVPTDPRADQRGPLTGRAAPLRAIRSRSGRTPAGRSSRARRSRCSAALQPLRSTRSCQDRRPAPSPLT